MKTISFYCRLPYRPFLCATNAFHGIMRWQKSILGIFLSIGIPLAAECQTKTVKNTNQQWIQYYGQANLATRWNVLADGGYRVEDNFSKRYQYIARVAMAYHLNSMVTLSGGFANLGVYSSSLLSKEEFRPFEELGIHQKSGNWNLAHRFRVEQRFVNSVVQRRIVHPGSFSFRFRYSFMTTIPLLRISTLHPEKRIDLNLGDEIFVNAGKNVVYNVFDQNRILISPALHLNSHLAVALTWNNQFASTTTQGAYIHTEVFWLQIKQDFNFMRKKS